MYIAMNRFKVAKTRAADFEALWRSRESYLHEMTGYVSFALLKGPEREDHQLYSSHTVWERFDDFKAWTTSEQFRKAHAQAGERTGKATDEPMTIGHPEFEGFHVMLHNIMPAGGLLRKTG
jgi:heme-degrading monooxygenase HmoA